MVEVPQARTPTSQFVVTWWNLPSGNVDGAFVLASFYDTEDQANEAANHIGREPPEMADVTPIDRYDRALNRK